MNNTARDRIFSRLRSASKGLAPPLPGRAPALPPDLGRHGKIDKLKAMMTAMRTEVHVVEGGRWVEVFTEILRGKGLGSLLYSSATDTGDALEKHWKRPAEGDEKLPELIPYDGNIENFKQRLFDVEAAITTSKGAIADVGAIILWPDEREPRTMSLVPPVHFVILNADAIYNNLSEVIEKENWHAKMPANAVLISGPSKTADIELTLAFGVHGPKELIVLIV